jgi:8-oxo-dGTP pyrophosphatase MutT (NUDIX family)
MNTKVMVIVVSEKGNFLLLRTNPEWLKVDEWFVVTGSVENNETDKEAVIRELKEEIGCHIKITKEELVNGFMEKIQ